MLLLLLLLPHLQVERCGELSGQSQVPASVLGEGQSGTSRPVQDPSWPPVRRPALPRPAGANAVRLGRGPTQALCLSPIHPGLPSARTTCWPPCGVLSAVVPPWSLGSAAGGGILSLTSEPLRGTLSGLPGRLLSWLHPDENTPRPPPASRSAAPGGLPLSQGKAEEQPVSKA